LTTASAGIIDALVRTSTLRAGIDPTSFNKLANEPEDEAVLRMGRTA